MLKVSETGNQKVLEVVNQIAQPVALLGGRCWELLANITRFYLRHHG